MSWHATCALGWPPPKWAGSLGACSHLSNSANPHGQLVKCDTDANKPSMSKILLRHHKHEPANVMYVYNFQALAARHSSNGMPT
eukprot:c40349_g1_i1 orf=2-253(+)